MNAKRCPARLAQIPVLLAILFSLSGCAVLGSISDSLFMMSPKEEIEFGAKARAQIEPKLTLDNDPVINAYVSSLGNQLWANTPKGEVSPRFHVVKDKELNAFAIPGGDVYVNTGTIAAADDEAELAGVIAHELGHVTRRHSASQVSRQQGMDAVTTILLGSDAAVAAQLLSGIVSSGVMFNYSREDEREADAIAVGTLTRIGYDPLAMRDFFTKIKTKYGDKSGPVTTLFASHPPTAERIANVENLAKQLPAKTKNRPTQQLNQIKARLK